MNNIKSETNPKNNPNYWAKVFKKEINPKEHKSIEFITNHLKKSDKILEAGCGPGKIVFKLLDLGYSNTIGLDFSNELISFCQNYSKESKLGSKKNFKTGDIKNIPFKDNSFDIYLSFGVIEHFLAKDQKKIIKEAHRILKKNGKVIITVPNSYSPNVIQRFIISKLKKLLLNEEMVYQKNISTKKIKKMFENEGFKTIECYNFGFEKAITRFFLLNYKYILKIRNPFSFKPIKNTIQRTSRKVEKYLFKFGETTVYIGIKNE